MKTYTLDHSKFQTTGIANAIFRASQVAKEKKQFVNIYENGIKVYEISPKGIVKKQ